MEFKTHENEDGVQYSWFIEFKIQLIQKLEEYELSLDDNHPNKPRIIRTNNSSKYSQSQCLDFCESYSKKRIWNKYIQTFKGFANPFPNSNLGENPNITLQDILDNPDLKLNSCDVSANANITPKMVLDHPEINWCFRCYSRNENVSWEFVTKKIDFNWSFDNLARNPNIDPRHLINLWTLIRKLVFAKDEVIDIYSEHNLDKLPRLFDEWSLSSNPNLTPELLEINDEIDWNYTSLSSNSGIPVDYIINATNTKIGNSQLWYWPFISCRATIEQVLANPCNNWSQETLSLSKYITPKGVDCNPQLPWDVKSLLRNSNFTLDDIRNVTRDTSWSDYIRYYQENDNFEWKDYLENPEVRWRFEDMMCLPKMTFEIIFNNPQIPWSREWVKQNIIRGNNKLKPEMNPYLVHAERLTLNQHEFFCSVNYRSRVANERNNRLKKELSRAINRLTMK